MASNSAADDALDQLGGKDKRMIERRLTQMAAEANIQTAGGLDAIGPMKRMPADLSKVRKITIGRHRAYYHGHHSNCKYNLFYVKQFKKSGVDDEDDAKFQRQLIKALAAGGERTIPEGE